MTMRGDGIMTRSKTEELSRRFQLYIRCNNQTGIRKRTFVRKVALGTTSEDYDDSEDAEDVNTIPLTEYLEDEKIYRKESNSTAEEVWVCVKVDQPPVEKGEEVFVLRGEDVEDQVPTMRRWLNLGL